jgi:hypothetical protein
MRRSSICWLEVMPEGSSRIATTSMRFPPLQKARLVAKFAPKYSPDPCACPARFRGSSPALMMGSMLASEVPWKTSCTV